LTRGEKEAVNHDRSVENQWEYDDFELKIRKGDGSNTYVIDIDSRAGEIQEVMHWPFDELELKNKLLKLEKAILLSGGTRRGISTQEEQVAQDFGEDLFKALLAGQVRNLYTRSLDRAERDGKGLRLRLHIQPPDLAQLPWEFLYDAVHDEYFCLYPNRPIVRYLDLPDPIEQLQVSPPLRILGMVASPSGWDTLDVEQEKGHVEQALKALQGRELVELTWVEGQSWRDLGRYMRRGPWHAFHFVGHGGFDTRMDEGAIVLSDDAGRPYLLRAKLLGRLLLEGHRSLRLVFLNSCEGARGSERDAFSSTATTLVRKGVPAVLAMQYEITDDAAIEFSRDFYEAVAEGMPVDAAVTAARRTVSISSKLEWGSPVLYMRSKDGRIFDIKEEHPAEQRTKEYRSNLELYWQDGTLSYAKVKRLANLRQELKLNLNVAASIEREVLGDTVEGTLKTQLNHYARVLRVCWRDRDPDARRHVADQMPREVVATLDRLVTDSTLTPAAAVGTLRSLADELGLSEKQAAEVEREVLGRTVEEMLYAKPEELPP
jgi:hypothetical protein